MRRAALLLLLIGCDRSGSDPYSQLTVYEPPGHEYRVRYLHPPWELITTDGSRAFLWIESDSMGRFGPEAGLPKFELTVTVESGDAQSRAALEASAALGRGERVIAGPQPIVTRQGVTGWDLQTAKLTSTTERNYRYVYLPSPSGVVRLYYEATPSLSTREVDAMIRSTEVAPL